jgi:hypothetical protein
LRHLTPTEVQVAGLLSGPPSESTRKHFIRGYVSSMRQIRERLCEVRHVLASEDVGRPVYRVVIRETATYVRLLWHLHQPSNSCSDGDGGVEAIRKGLAASPTSLWDHSASAELMDRVSSVEAQAMMQLDVPLFYSSPRTPDLYFASPDGKGMGVIKEVFRPDPDLMERLLSVTTGQAI